MERRTCREGEARRSQLAASYSRSCTPPNEVRAGGLDGSLLLGTPGTDRAFLSLGLHVCQVHVQSPLREVLRGVDGEAPGEALRAAPRWRAGSLSGSRCRARLLAAVSVLIRLFPLPLLNMDLTDEFLARWGNPGNDS